MRASKLEMHALLLRLAHGSKSPTVNNLGDNHADEGGRSAIQRMTAFVCAHYREGITTRQIAAKSGMHPNYAMKLFRNVCGMTLHDYLVENRLFHAKRLLATTGNTVLEIAMESGFGSASRFYDSFTKTTGLSPLQFRKKLLVG